MNEIPYDLGKEHCFQSNSTEMTVESESGEVFARAVDIQTGSDWLVVDFDMKIAWFLSEDDAQTRIQMIADESSRFQIVEE